MKKKLTQSLNLQNTSPMIPDKSFYTPTISTQIPSTENLFISPNETQSDKSVT